MESKKLKNILVEFLILTAVVFCAAAVNCHTHGLNIYIAVKFSMYMLFCIFIPGYAICCLLKIEHDKEAVMIAYSLGLGYSIAIVEYLVFILFVPDAFFGGAAGCVSLICIIYMIKKGVFGKGMFQWKFSFQFCLCIAFLAVILFIGYYTVSLVYTLPGETPSGNAYHPDFLFWVGNNISATKGFPLQDFRQVGYEFNYHYFSSLFIAHISMVTGIDVVILSAYFTSIAAACLLVYGLYALLTTIIKNTFYIALGYLLFIFAEGTYASFESHTFFQPFGYDYGISMGMLAMASLIYLHEKKEVTISDYILSAIYLGICTGTKGPIGIVVLGGFGISSFLFLLEKKWSRAFIGGSIWLGVFLAVYFLFIRGAYTSIGPSIDYVGVKGALGENPYIQLVLKEYPMLTGLPTIFKALTVIPLYLFESSYISNLLWFLAVIMMIVMIVKREGRWHILFMLNVIALFGNALGVMFNMPGGGSQTYFIMAAMPFALTAGLFTMQRLSKSRIVGTGILCMIMLLFLFQCSKLIPKYRERIEVGLNASSGARVFWSVSGMYCNDAQWEAYFWLRENTGENQIMAIDNFGTVEEYNNQRNIAGVMSERYIWNDNHNVFWGAEAERRNRILESIDVLDDDSAKMLQNENVDYYLQNKQYSAENIDNSTLIKVVFDNESYRIYQVQEGGK